MNKYCFTNFQPPLHTCILCKLTMPVFIITVKYRLQRKPIVRVYVDNNMQIRTFKARHNLKIIYRINRQARKNNLKRITFDGCSKNEQDG